MIKTILLFVLLIIVGIVLFLYMKKHANDMSEWGRGEREFAKKHPIIYNIFRIVILTIAIIWLLGTLAWEIILQ